MENQVSKCSLKKHAELNAISFCQECKLYMCNKCLNLHTELFESKNHKTVKLNKETKELFTGLCPEEKHKEELEYYCKTHNKLCCSSCLSVVKSKGNGQHKDCSVCNIEEIKEEKKNKLKDNIKYLEDSSKTLNISIKKLKEIYEKLNKEKEELKLRIQKIFTKIKNAINEREDEILLSVDNKYDYIYYKEDLIQKCEKLPSKIKEFLEKGKSIENEWDEKNIKLNSLINDCINLENNIVKINTINEKLKKSICIKIKFIFDKEEKDINSFIEIIKSFGKIIEKTYEEEILKFTDNYMKTKIEQGIKNIFGFSLASHVPIQACVPHITANAFRNICALSLGTNVLIDATKNINEAHKKNGELKEDKKPKKEEKPKEEEDDIDLGGLY